MIEIDKSLVKKWDAIEGRNEKFAPYNIDINCTNDGCRRSLVNCVLRWNDALDFCYTSVRCAFCNEYLRFFLIDTPKSLQPEDVNKCRVLIIPPLSVKLDFSQELQDLSPQFIKIYKQAYESELLNLDELAGMGYRKALEFLIKDYLILILLLPKDEIAKKLLGNCIKENVNDPRLKACAERTAWLGNDETHYQRTWTGQDIQDLKKLLQLTTYWIESEFLTQKYMVTMPKK